MKPNRKNLLLATALILALTMPTVRAAAFTWDANSSLAGAQDGGGTWATGAGNWRNSTTSTDNQNWDNATLDSAAFGAGTDGTYAITLSGTVRAAGGVTFNNSGYTLSGTALSLLNAAGTGNAAITVATGKTATINSVLSHLHNTAATITSNANSVLNLGGGTTLNSNPQLTLSGAGTINITAGTFTNSIGSYNAAIMNQTGGTWTTTAQGTNLSASIGNAAGRDVNYTVSGTATLNVLASNTASTTYTLSLGRNMGNFKSTLTLQTGGTVNVGTTTDRAGQINLGSFDANGNSLLDVQGGNLTIGTGKTVNKLYFFAAGANASKTATMTQSGGTSTLNGIQFGANTGDTAGGVIAANAYDASALATLRLSGNGSLYVGAQGITRGTAANSLAVAIQLQGGTLGASQNWSSALNMTLGTTAGGLIIRAQDSSTNARSITLSGNLSNDTTNGTFTKTGTGTLTLSGANNYSGGTTLNEGMLQFGKLASMPSSGAVAVTGGTLAVNVGGAGEWTTGTSGNGTIGGLLAGLGGQSGGTVTYAGNVTLGIDTTSGGDQTYAGAISNVGTTLGLTKLGSNNLTLSTANTYTGATTISAGKIIMTNSAALQFSAYNTTGSTGAIGLDVTAGLSSGTLTLGGLAGAVDVATAITAYSSVSNLTLNPQTGTTPSYSGIIANGSGSMNLTKTGNGTQIFSGSNSYSGVTTISGGTLQVATLAAGGSNSSIGSPGTNVVTGSAATDLVIDGGTLRYAGTTAASTNRLFTIGTGGATLDASGATLGTLSFTGTGSLAFSSSAATASLTLTGTGTGATGAGSLASIIGNSGSGANITSLTKSGTGTWSLSGASTYTGNTTISGGTLQLASGGRLGGGNYAGALDIASGATFQYSNGAAAQTLTGVVGTGGGTVSNSAGLILQNANNAFGTLNITGGRVFIQSNAGALAASSTVNITGGRLVLEVGGSPTYNQAIAVTSGGISARNASTLSNVTLPGSGLVTLNNDDAITSTLTITNAQSLTGNLDVRVGGTHATIGNATLSGDITGASGALTKSGAGRLILSGANSYTGTTTVNAGSLTVNGNQEAATGALTVVVGATNATAARLQGVGTVGGNTSFAADPDGAGAQVGGIHSPGNSVGKQTFDQAGASTTTLTYNAGSIFEWELASTPAETAITDPVNYASNRGTAYDAVNVTGALGGTGAIFRVVLDGNQNFSDAFWVSNRTWSDIFRTGDGTGTSNVSFDAIFGGGFQYYNYSGSGSTLAEITTPSVYGSFAISGSTLTWSAVPEPSTTLVGLLVGAGLLRRRRTA